MTINYVPDIVVEGTGPQPSPIPPIIVDVSLVQGVVLVQVMQAQVTGTQPIVQYRLYRGESSSGPWTAFPAQNISKIAVQTILFDWNPAYGVQEYYAVTAVDASGKESLLSPGYPFAAAWNQQNQANVPLPSPPAVSTDYGFDRPEDLLTDQFPEEPYNFYQPPPGMTIGPLHLLCKIGAQALLDFRSRVLLLLESISVSTARGAALDAHAVLYGVSERFPQEVGNDSLFRQRVLSLAQASHGCLADIQAAIVAHYASKLPSTAQPVVTVFDRRSNPVQAAADGLQILQFVVSVAFKYSAANAWFLNYAFLGNSTYLGQDRPRFVKSLGPDVDAIMDRFKAANTQPLYKVSATYD